MIGSLLLYLLACMGLQVAQAAIITGNIEVPTYAEPCFRNTHDFDPCVKRVLQSIMPKLAKAGIPELELESVDPLKVRRMEMSYDTNTIVGKVTLQDTVTRGISKLKIMQVRSVLNESLSFWMEIGFFIPKLVTSGMYNMEGNVGDIPIFGEDTFNITIGGISGVWRLYGSAIEEDGQIFMRMDKFEVLPEVQAVKVHVNNLFRGNPELSAISLAFVNRFWRVLYMEMLPYAQETFDTVARQIVNKIFLKIPYNQLFPLTPDSKTSSIERF